MDWEAWWLQSTGSQRVRHDWATSLLKTLPPSCSQLDKKEKAAYKKYKGLIYRPLQVKEIKTLSPKGNQPQILIGRTDVEAEAPILWPPDAKSRLTGKDPVAGKDWRQNEKRVAEDEIVGWHQWFNAHELEWTPGGGEGRGDWRAGVQGVAKIWTWLCNWKTTQVDNCKTFRGHVP